MFEKISSLDTKKGVIFHIFGLSQRGKKGQEISESLIASYRMISHISHYDPLKINSPKEQMRKINKIVKLDV